MLLQRRKESIWTVELRLVGYLPVSSGHGRLSCPLTGADQIRPAPLPPSDRASAPLASPSLHVATRALYRVRLMY